MFNIFFEQQNPARSHVGIPDGAKKVPAVLTGVDLA